MKSNQRYALKPSLMVPRFSSCKKAHLSTTWLGSVLWGWFLVKSKQRDALKPNLIVPMLISSLVFHKLAWKRPLGLIPGEIWTARRAEAEFDGPEAYFPRKRCNFHNLAWKRPLGLIFYEIWIARCAEAEFDGLEAYFLLESKFFRNLAWKCPPGLFLLWNLNSATRWIWIWWSRCRIWPFEFPWKHQKKQENNSKKKQGR